MIAVTVSGTSIIVLRTALPPAFIGAASAPSGPGRPDPMCWPRDPRRLPLYGLIALSVTVAANDLPCQPALRPSDRAAASSPQGAQPGWRLASIRSFATA